MKASLFYIGHIHAETQTQKTAERVFMKARVEKRKSQIRPSYEEMILASVQAQKSRRGTSRPAIQKYMCETFNVENSANSRRHISVNLKKLMLKNKLVLAGAAGRKGSGSFKLGAPGAQDALDAPTTSGKSAGKNILITRKSDKSSHKVSKNMKHVAKVSVKNKKSDPKSIPLKPASKSPKKSASKSSPMKAASDKKSVTKSSSEKPTSKKDFELKANSDSFKIKISGNQNSMKPGTERATRRN